MRKTLIRFVRRLLAPFQTAPTFQADFDDVAEMVLVARALRAEGYGASFDERPLRLLVTLPRAAGATR